MSEKKRVLIVDDDPDYVAAISALLEGSGYEVSRAGSGKDGLDLAKTVRPDLILLDVMMTERTEGFFTLQAMRSVPALADVPIVIASSVYTEYPHFRVNPKAGWLPADQFLAKPIDPETLLSEVERLISARRVAASVDKTA
ncbi:MAG: response regulator [Acidobacteriia bacterium]|nr:response regulator [Terriglobia bacterium]